jgi:hypothetical protein
MNIFTYKSSGLVLFIRMDACSKAYRSTPWNDMI